jgi:four helix bundle protein
MVYKVTKEFPKEEQFSLTDQLRRAVTSITNNIAEGFSRSSGKDKAKFYYTSLGSLTEVQNQLLVAKDLSYLSKQGFEQIAEQTIVVNKLLSGLIKSANLMNL